MSHHEVAAVLQQALVLPRHHLLKAPELPAHVVLAVQQLHVFHCGQPPIHGAMLPLLEALFPLVMHHVPLLARTARLLKSSATQLRQLSWDAA